MKKNPGNNRKPGAFFVENEDKIREVIDDYVPFLLKTKREQGAEEAYLYSRNFIEEVKKKTLFDSKISCDSSCSFCCHDKVKVSHDEGEYIKRFINENSIVPNQERLKEQKENPNKLSWKNKACSLLLDANESGNRLCSIYNERPIICRTHNSVEPPINCDRSEDPNKTIGEIRVPLIDGVMIASIIAGGKPTQTQPELFDLTDYL